MVAWNEIVGKHHSSLKKPGQWFVLACVLVYTYRFNLVKLPYKEMKLINIRLIDHVVILVILSGP